MFELEIYLCLLLKNILLSFGFEEVEGVEVDGFIIELAMSVVLLFVMVDLVEGEGVHVPMVRLHYNN